MGVTPASPNRMTRCGLGEAALASDNMYASWYWRFILLFGGLAVCVVGAAWLNTSLTRNQQYTVTGVTIALVLWFWCYGQWDQIKTDAHAVVYLLGNVAGIVVLIRTWDGSALLLFAMYWFGFAYLYTRYALVYAFILTLSTQWAFGTVGNDIGWNLNTLAGIGLLIVLLGFSGMMARYIEAFQTEAEVNRHLLQELKQAQQTLIEREREAGIEQERQRMAGEIHDTLAQHFTSIITNLRAARELESSEPALVNQHISHAFSAAQQGLTDSRAVLATMQPDVLLGRSLTEVLQAISSEWDAQSGTDIGFTTEGTAGQLSRAQESLLVRALQEALRNIDKHAQANQVNVRVSWLEDEMLLDISDDGAGFDPAAIQAGKNGYQLGIATMESRVEAAGGTFALESAPGEGASITISFPTGGEA